MSDIQLPDSFQSDPRDRSLSISQPSNEAAPYVIRPALPGDAQAVGKVLDRSYRTLLADDYEPDLLRAALPLISRARPSLLTCGTYFVLEQGEEILVAGGWSDMSPHGRPAQRGEGHIRHVACDPKVARQGLAAALMDRVLVSAAAAGVTRLHCQSTLTAAPFYKACGFVPRGRIDVRLPTGLLFPAVQMLWEAGRLAG